MKQYSWKYPNLFALAVTLPYLTWNYDFGEQGGGASLDSKSHLQHFKL